VDLLDVVDLPAATRLEDEALDLVEVDLDLEVALLAEDLRAVVALPVVVLLAAVVDLLPEDLLEDLVELLPSNLLNNVRIMKIYIEVYKYITKFFKKNKLNYYGFRSIRKSFVFTKKSQRTIYPFFFLYCNCSPTFSLDFPGICGIDNGIFFSNGNNSVDVKDDII